MAVRPTFILASASPARLGLLRNAGFDPTVVVSHVDESTVVGPADVVSQSLARMKAEAVAARLPDHGRDAYVLGCDSVLEFDGETLGKPADAEEARQRWSSMRGRSGTLHTGHCLINPHRDRTAKAVGRTTIHFGAVSDAEIEAYVESGEPLHVAGGFTIDGRGGFLVDSIEGDASNVIGLSLPVLRSLLREFGLSVADFWRD